MNLAFFLHKNGKDLLSRILPYRDGHLAENVECKPFEIIYKSLYARYMYEGFVYVDPIYKKKAVSLPMAA